MAVSIKKGSALASLSLTPLIDVVFLLLIFFLVATKFAEEEKEERELPLDLPEASEAQPITSEPREMYVNIDAEGRYHVAGGYVDLDQLFQALKMAWVNNPAQASVVIRADKNCRWQPIVAVLNLCKKAEIRNYRIDTKPIE
ncbi:MAG: ExbD/TolR family protein [Planctomycetota bacterium]|jgi:biopolymer transport protein ExbD